MDCKKPVGRLSFLSAVIDYSVIQGLSGQDPLDLLRSASATHDKTAVGRFAMYASRVSALDPVSAFEAAATGKLLKKSVEGIKQYKGSRGLQQLCRQVGVGSAGRSRVVGVAKSGIIFDHSVGERRKRKCRSEADLGRPQDCPKRRRVRWDVTSSESTAAAVAAAATWLDPDETGKDPSKMKFKCRIVLQGSDVFSGLRALVDAGETSTVLPDCVRDAPSLGGSIRVVDGVSKDCWTGSYSRHHRRSS